VLNNQEVTIDNAHVVAWSQTIDYSIHLENGFCLSEQVKVWLIPSGEQEKSTFKVSTFKPSQAYLIDAYQNVHEIKESNLDR